MINPILLLSISSPGSLYEMTYKMDKCYISGEIIDIKLVDKKICSDILNIDVKGENNFSITASKSNSFLCTGYNNFFSPQVGDQVNYLVESEDFRLISDEYEDGNFRLTSGEILQQEINACEVEKIKIEKDSIYIGIILILIFVLMILIVFLYRKILKK